jgi:nucleoside-diphosphate-sugar epimerase
VKNILVTGSNGYVGNNLKIFIKTKKLKFKFFYTDIHNLDILDKKKIYAFIKKYNINTIIHLAAIQNVKESFEKPELYIKTNITGTVNLLEAAGNLKVSKFIFLSSISVHGSSNKIINENSSINPIHVYGATKAACEALIKSYSNKYSFNYFILRPNLIVGFNKNKNFFDFIAEEIKNHKTYTLFGEGTHRRDWIHVFDVALAIVLLLKNNKLKNLTFCLGNNRAAYLSVARKIANKFPKSKALFKSANAQTFSLCCTSKNIIQNLRWNPKFGLDKIINEYYEKYK